jgi:hypothetical protein
MAGFFVGLDGRRPDQGFLQLREIFNLENQLLSLEQHCFPSNDTEFSQTTVSPLEQQRPT